MCTYVVHVQSQTFSADSFNLPLSIQEVKHWKDSRRVPLNVNEDFKFKLHIN